MTDKEDGRSLEREAWNDLGLICADPPAKRDICSRCEYDNYIII